MLCSLENVLALADSVSFHQLYYGSIYPYCSGEAVFLRYVQEQIQVISPFMNDEAKKKKSCVLKGAFMKKLNEWSQVT